MAGNGAWHNAMKDWNAVHAPDLSAFDQMAQAAFDCLPLAFRERCSGLLILVEEFPDDSFLVELDLESPYDLLGLYHGVDLTQKSFSDAVLAPDTVFLFRRPILDFWAGGRDPLGKIITHVLVHEIGHHFGLSDRDMEAIEAQSAAI